MRSSAGREPESMNYRSVDLGFLLLVPRIAALSSLPLSAPMPPPAQDCNPLARRPGPAPGPFCFMMRVTVTDDEWMEFDLSALTYPQFLAFFFDRPVVGDDKCYDLFRSGIDSFEASDPAAVVSHLQTMCTTFPELARAYSQEQLDQELWAVFGSAISCERFLFDPAVDSTLRTACIESMYLPFAEVVSRLSIDIHETFYWMWWDMILHTFWENYDPYFLTGDSPPHYVPPDYEDPALLDEQGKQMSEVLFKVLSRILEIPNRGCHFCALHGFGHLHYSKGSETVQKYIDTHRDELSSEELHWVEGCRDGTVQ
jgi:hypothetical protein